MSVFRELFHVFLDAMPLYCNFTLLKFRHIYLRFAATMTWLERGTVGKKYFPTWQTELTETWTTASPSWPSIIKLIYQHNREDRGRKTWVSRAKLKDWSIFFHQLNRKTPWCWGKDGIFLTRTYDHKYTDSYDNLHKDLGGLSRKF